MKLAVALVLAGLLHGCSGMLPQSRQEVTHPWRDFDGAKKSFDLIEPYVTDLATVRALGFDPNQTPNMQVLNQAQVVSAVLPSPLQEKASIPQGILDCMQAQDGCVGYAVEPSQIDQNRVGNFFLDFLNFKRETLTTGWKFSALIVVIHNTVVYKQWNGQPKIETTERHTNPLGPLQSIDESALLGP